MNNYGIPPAPLGTPANAMPQGGPQGPALSVMPNPNLAPMPGGLASLGQAYANGGAVIPLAEGGKIAVGPGNGMDDLIPTTIDGRELAALSDGEFVIPADVVSMMGDGSTKGGAERLYQLVSQIRQAKTGTDAQAEPLQFSDILQRIAQ